LSKYIIDILGDVDEELLEEALDLPQQSDEVVFEVDERRRRGSVFAAAAAIAASLAVAAGVVLFRSNFGKISPLPNDSSITDISTSDDFPGQIVIPNKFSEDDMELQDILEDISEQAVELCETFGYYGNPNISGNGDKQYFLFPQMVQPITYQFDKYDYTACPFLKTQNLRERLYGSFSADAAEKFANSICGGVIVDRDTNNPDRTINITEGGSFNENGFLTEAPKIIELDNGAVFKSFNYYGRNFDGYWSTAKVISRSDSEIIFSYIYEDNERLFETKGRLVNENGWKFSWFEDWIF